MGIGGRRRIRVLCPSLFSLLFLVISECCTAIDTLTSNFSVTVQQTLISKTRIFELGFFTPNNSRNHYIGIWYTRISDTKVVWVANREKPLTDSSGVFTISSSGNLLLLDGKQNVVWQTNVSVTSNVASAVLLDSGNLVLSEVNNSKLGKVLWESFNFPTNTFLPSMKIGLNTKSGEKRFLTAWKSEDDPSPGNFTLGVESSIPSQGLVFDGSDRYFRTGQWNGRAFIGTPDMDTVYFNGYSLLPADQEGALYFTLTLLNATGISCMVIDPSGDLKHSRWEEQQQKWNILWESRKSRCDVYGTCGPFGNCNVLESPICKCFEGFEPKSIKEWNEGNWTSGCVRRTRLQYCNESNNSSNSNNSYVGKNNNGDGFLRLEGMKLPDFADYLTVADAQECQVGCLNNCSCLGYAFVSGIKCMVWSNDLMDVRTFSQGGEVLYLRLAHSELPNKKRDKKVIIISTVLGGTIAMCVCPYILWRWMAKQIAGKKKKKGMEISFVQGAMNKNMFEDEMKQGKGRELPLFNFEKLAIATNNFDLANKLGQGGFGPVYKGKLPEGQEIAVKRLSKSSGQGLEEFKNEVIVISKLQHRNLVRLLGCCFEEEENMLIYEYMPNKSLDAFLFDPNKRTLLDWTKRFHIIEGIGRGLLYLHRDSRLRIIHRDLKASNILLDVDLNPKISDFGTARIFGGNQNQEKTKRVVGTYGYMSPEYAMEGRFSEKSDVFSFGVLLLEIVSGKRNNSSYYHEQSLSLLGHAWQLWNEDMILALVDTTVCEPCFHTEILRCIHVGFLCVQEFAKDRPTVSTILSMLNSEIAILPTPKQPAFTARPIPSDISSINNVTITDTEGR